jgi:hypothetical protein
MTAHPIFLSLLASLTAQIFCILCGLSLPGCPKIKHRKDKMYGNGRAIFSHYAASRKARTLFYLHLPSTLLPPTERARARLCAGWHMACHFFIPQTEDAKLRRGQTEKSAVSLHLEAIAIAR